MSTSELVSFSSTPGTSSALSLDPDSFLESREFMENEYGFRCIRKVDLCTDTLTQQGMLQFYDECTGHIFKEVDLRNDKSFNGFSDNQVEYQVRTSGNACMLLDTAGEDNNIILIDPFNYKSSNTIQVRFINEAYPEKLIASDRFDDAELFAKPYGLDVRKIHIKRAFD
uniref:Uncharacterized protein n=1 Tax=Panagrolaimus davidi TaxID=227884 RepID=A0A914RDR4_9BILA